MSLFKGSIKSAMSEYLEDLKLKLDGLTEPELRWQSGLESNTIIWLVWHMARVEDNWINGVVGGNDTVWSSGGWSVKTGIDAEDNGNGDTPDDVRALPAVAVTDLMDYFEAVRSDGLSVIDGLDDDDLGREFIRRGRSVTLEWILGHVVVDESQHLGQVAYVRGIIRGLNG